MEFARNEFVLLAVTFGVFFVSKLVQRRTGMVLLNPILLTVAVLIAFLKLTGVDYGTYAKAGEIVSFWLKPAVVALGVPLYLQLESIKKQFVPIIVSQLAGCVAGVVSVVLIARALGASEVVAASLAAKSVTTPIAMEVTEALGGIPALTAAVVVCVGILGAVSGFRVLKAGKVRSPMAQGISMGTASHAVGTSAAMERGRKWGAYASLGLTLNGILTAFLAPAVMDLLNF